MDTFSLRGIKYALSKQEVLIRLQFYFSTSFVHPCFFVAKM